MSAGKNNGYRWGNVSTKFPDFKIFFGVVPLAGTSESIGKLSIGAAPSNKT
jgi:hypothetical protein